MADVAYLLHWTPESLDVMDPGELGRWRNLAVARHNAVHAPPNNSG